MGIVIDFPMGQRLAQGAKRDEPGEPASVVILPVIRVERSPDRPSDLESGARGPARKRRRRAARS